jgi:hypothetical protein
LEDVPTRPGIGEIRKLIEGTLLMKTRVKSLALACGLAVMVFSWSAGSARAQGSASFSSGGVASGMNTGGFAGLAGFYQGYGYQAPAAPTAFTNPPPVLVPKVLTSYVPSYEGLQSFYGPKFAGGAYRPYAYYYAR